MKLNTYILFFVTAAAGILCADLRAQQLSDRYFSLLNQADSLVKASKWKEAEATYMEFLKENPGNSTNILIMANVGMLRHYSGNDSAAIEILDKVVDMAPRSVTVRSIRAKVLSSLGRLDDALTEYGVILELDSLVLEPRYMKFIIEIAKGRSVDAIDDLNFMQRHFPNEAETLEAQSYYDISEKDYKSALMPLTKLLSKRQSASAYADRAYCNLMTDNLTEASSDIHEAMRLDPANGELYLLRALLNRKRFRPADAMEDARRAATLGVSAKNIRALGF